MDSYIDERTDSTWNSVKLVYILHLIGAFTGLPVFIGAILSHVKRGDGGPAANSHLERQISVFWTFVITWIVGVMTTFLLGLGLIILFFGWVWFVWQMVIGLSKASDYEPI